MFTDVAQVLNTTVFRLENNPVPAALRRQLDSEH